TAVPAGSLLVTNGAVSTDHIVALDPATGAVLADLDLGRDIDPVAGVYHPGEGTLFLLDAAHDEVVEIDPATGAELSRFSSPLPVFHGGLAVHPTTGNLWVASSLSTSVAEITPAGGLLRTVDLGLSGLLPEASGLVWV